MLPPSHTRRPSALKLGNDARGGGLAVAAGHAENGTRTDGEERLHLARDDRAVRLRLQQLRHVGTHPGRAEDNVRVQIAQITLAEVQHRAERLVVRRRAAERRALLPVAGDDLHTVPRQQLHERTVAHAEADDRGGLSFMPCRYSCSVIHKYSPLNIRNI